MGGELGWDDERIEREIGDQIRLGDERSAAAEPVAQQPIQLVQGVAHRRLRSGTSRGRSPSRASPSQCSASTRSSTRMRTRSSQAFSTLNAAAADVLRPFEPNAVTDVTGFGLFGHAHEMAERSGVQIVIEADRVPAIDGALDLARKGVRTSGDPRNRDFAAAHVSLAPEVSPAIDALGFDPQTAGGLLEVKASTVAFW